MMIILQVVIAVMIIAIANALFICAVFDSTKQDKLLFGLSRFVLKTFGDTIADVTFMCSLCMSTFWGAVWFCLGVWLLHLPWWYVSFDLLYSPVVGGIVLYLQTRINPPSR